VPTFLYPVDLAKNELKNARLQNLASAPSSPVAGQLYFDTTLGRLRWYSGSAWVDAQGDEIEFGPVIETTEFGLDPFDGDSTTVAHANHEHGTPAHDGAAHATIALSDLNPPSGDLDLVDSKIINLGDPTGDGDAANKGYVDTAVDTARSGLDFKESVRVATTGPISIAQAPATIDGVTLDVGDRVLVKDQAAAVENGIRVFNGEDVAMPRAADANSDAEVTPGMIVAVEAGTHAETVWVLANNGPITLDSTGLYFTWYRPPDQVTVSAPLERTGNTIALTGTVPIANGGTGATTAEDARANLGIDEGGSAAEGYAADIGDGSATAIVVTHNLGTRDLVPALRATASPWNFVDAEVEATSTNTVTVRFGTAPASGAYRLILVPLA
jgi:hypothetical protein